jgi:NAD(P) transhydrogenase subunit beta
MDQIQEILNQYSILLFCYLIGSVTFIIGLKQLSHPDTARKGNLVAAAGMTLAIIVTIFLFRGRDGAHLHNYIWIFSGLVVGSIVGTLAAKKVQMPAMP